MSLLPFLAGPSATGDAELDALFKNSAGPAKLPKVSYGGTSGSPAAVERKEKRRETAATAKGKNATAAAGAKRSEKKRRRGGGEDGEGESEDEEDAIERAYEARQKKRKARADRAGAAEKGKRRRKEDVGGRRGETAGAPVEEEEEAAEGPEDDDDDDDDDDDKIADINGEESEEGGEAQEEKQEEERGGGRDAEEEGVAARPKEAKGSAAAPRAAPAKDSAEELARTLFVGNLPSSVVTVKAHKKQLINLFKKYGKVDSIRFRSIAFAEMKQRKASFIEKNFHPERHTVNSYVKFALEADARRALELNGTEFMGRHVRVDAAADSGKNHDHKRSVFVGNLPLDAEEEALWEAFGVFGAVESVRIVRDRATNVGKGFGYVQFAKPLFAELALKLHDTKVCGRKVRVFRCNKQAATKRASSAPAESPAPSKRLKKDLSTAGPEKTGGHRGGVSRSRARATAWRKKARASADTREGEGAGAAPNDAHNEPKHRTNKRKKTAPGGAGAVRVSAAAAKAAKERKAARKVSKALKKRERKSK